MAEAGVINPRGVETIQSRIGRQVFTTNIRRNRTPEQTEAQFYRLFNGMGNGTYPNARARQLREAWTGTMLGLGATGRAQGTVWNNAAELLSRRNNRRG